MKQISPMPVEMRNIYLIKMNAQKRTKKEDKLVPDIEKVREIKTASRKESKKEIDEPRITGPKTTHREEKDPGEYPMK